MVVLPAPFGPSRAKTSPSSTVSDTPATASRLPYRLTNPSISMAGTASAYVAAQVMQNSLPSGSCITIQNSPNSSTRADLGGPGTGQQDGMLLDPGAPGRLVGTRGRR